MVQPMVQNTSASRPSPWWNRVAPWIVRLLYIAFFFFMLFKQVLALNLAGLGIGGRMIPATVGVLLFLLPWLMIRPGRGQLIGAFVVDLLLTLVSFADVLYFRQFGDLTSVAALRFATQLTDVSSSVTELLQPGDLLFWADLPILLILAIFPTSWAKRIFGRLWEEFQRMRLRGPVALVVALIGGCLMGYTVLTDPFISAKWTGHTAVASRLGLVNYHVYDLATYGSRMVARVAPSDSAVQEVSDWFSTHRSNQEDSPLFGVARGKNVIMVQLESYQAVNLNRVVNGQEITPNLNRLARESINFTEAYHQTGQGVTSDADLLGNCSLYPTRTGAVYYDYASNDFRCSPEVLREHGYTAVAMQGIRPDFWNLSAAYPQVGFQRYFSEGDYDLSDSIGLGVSDVSFLQQSVDKLKSLQEPYYAYLVTLTSHGPFDFEGLPHELDLGNLEGTEWGNYLQAVHYTDKAIGLFLDRLEEEGILDNAVLVVYGDHIGLSRTATGFQELLGSEATDEVALYRMEHRIPLMIRLPGGEAAGDRTQVVGQADIAPTLFGLLGISTEDTFFMGRDLLATQEGVVPFYTGSAMNDQYLFLADEDQGVGQCWDRQTGQKVDVSQCQTLSDEAAEALHISRLMVERDLIPDVLAAGEK